MREDSHSPQRRVDAVPDQDAIVAGHMRDLLKSHPPTFYGSSNGLEAETWILDMGRYFSMHLYRSNTKARCAIMHLHDFSSTWWHMEEQKLHLDITIVSWELFL